MPSIEPPPAPSRRRPPVRPAPWLVVAAWWIVSCPPANAQNDWQFPDPRFGAAVAGSPPPTVADERRYRAAITPPFAPSGRQQMRAPPPHERRRGRLRRR